MANRIKLAGTTANAFTIGLNGVTLDSSNAASAYTLVLPSTDGNANQVLSTDGSGNLNWTDVQAGTPNAIVNGTSNVTVDANSNVRVSVAGTANTVTFTSSNTIFNSGAGGNITGANLVQANFFSGNGSLLTGIVAGASNAIVSGNSNVTVDANSNVRVSVSGNANVATFTDTGLVLGTGTGGNITNANVISANLFSGNGALLNALNGANVTGIVANANYAAFSGNITVNAQPNITSLGTLSSLDVNGTANLGQVANVKILGGSNLQVLSTDGTGNLNWVTQTGGSGTPGGNTTELQFNNSGTFGGIPNVIFASGNLSLGNVANVKMTGGANLDVVGTDGNGNLSFRSIALDLLVGTRIGPVEVPITNYTFEVETRSSGNVTVYVN